MENFRKYLKEQSDEVGTISALISPAGTDFVVTTGEGRVVAIEQLRDISDPRMQKMASERGFEIDRPLTDFSYDTVEIIAQGTGELPQEDAAMRKIRAWMKGSGIREAISLDIEVGDVILGGKYKNKRMVVKDIGKDELGQPTINGKSILKFRIEKFLPDEKKSKKTLDDEKESKE
jgi:hypothetical protein